MKNNVFARATMMLVVILLVLRGTIVSAQSPDTIGVWNVAELREVPVHSWLERERSVHSLLYQGQPLNGRATDVFAYYASPATLQGKQHGADREYPGVVLIHGGGGTAFAEWAYLWAARGYAAIAMDLSGSRPPDVVYDAAGRPVAGQAHRREGRTPLENGGLDQGHQQKFDSIGGTVEDDWPWHAASAGVLAHSLLRSFPDVDPERTAVTGISWGGYTTCLVASLDDRFQAAVPVYGCGFLHEGESVQKPAIDKLGDRRQQWIETYDPGSLLPHCRVPILFVNGTHDVHYPLDSYRKSFDSVPGEQKWMRIELRMGHSHPAGWAPAEIGLFIDSYCKGGTPLLIVGQPVVDGGSVTAALSGSSKVQSAAVHYTVAGGLRSQREWQTLAATVQDGSVTASGLPAEANSWIVTVTDDRGAQVSSVVQLR